MRFKEVKKIISESEQAEQLLEINMSPGALAKLASQIDARAGMEFEMIVPDVEGGDDGEQEPDYDQDEGVGDIEDACNFFYDGDFNSRRDINRLRESMLEDYQNWVYEKIDDDWSNDGFEFFKEYLDREDPYDRDEGLDNARDYVSENNPELEPGTDEYDEAVSERLNEQEAEYYQEQWEEQGRNYDYAREEFESEKQDDYDQGDWLNDAGIGSMTDVSREYDIQWPHYTSVSAGGREIEDVADSFSRAIGRPVNSSKSYHGARREEGHYVVEPDGSLEGDSPGDKGLEFVSPPLPLSELLSDLEKVKKWAKSEGAYTGSDFGTGLHINVSVPGLGKNQENLDYVKLALLLGDEHVLKEFERVGNTYCKSGLEIVKKNIKDKPEQAKALLDQMKSNLEQLASRAVHNAITNKFTSINTKDGYVEFRSPGGDWLNEKFDKIEPTLLRFIVALDAAVKPDLYRQEYLKKLYKALAPSGNKSTIEYFAKYVAGEIPKAALRSFVKQAQLERSLAKGKKPGQMWWNVQWDANRRMEVVAGSKEVAKQVAAEEWGVPESQLAGAVVTPLRPYTEPPAGSELERIERQAGVGQRPNQTLGGRPSNPDGDWYLKNSETDEIVYRFNAANYQDAYTVLQQWKDEYPGSENIVYGRGRAEPAQQNTGLYKIFSVSGQLIAGDEYGSDRAALERAAVWATRRGVDVVVKNAQGEEIGRVSAFGEITPTARQPAASTGQGNWGIWIGANARFANQPGTYARGETPPLIRFPSREAAEQWIEQQRAERPNMRADIEVREIEPAAPIPGSTLDLQRQRAAQADTTQQQSTGNNLRPTGPGPWEVANVLNNQVYYNTGHTNRAAAEEEARTWLTQNGHNPVQFEVRTRESVNAPRTLTTPGQGQQVFTGEWKVVDPQGNEIYRFSGVGNNQSDANAVAIRWLGQNPRHMQGGVEVLPVMG